MVLCLCRGAVIVFFVPKVVARVQRTPLLCAPGLVKFVPAVARLFHLALPVSFLTMFAQNKGDLCTSGKPLWQANAAPCGNNVPSFHL